MVAIDEGRSQVNVGYLNVGYTSFTFDAQDSGLTPSLFLPTTYSDFNKGKILRFNRDTNSYCGLRINCYKSDYRAPENNACVDDGNEASDTFSFGNNIYLILTGLWPYFDYPDGRKQKKRLYEMIANGEILPTVHPRFRTRSRIEAGLVKIMEQCWEHDFHKRISIFSVLQQLYELREKTEQRTG